MEISSLTLIPLFIPGSVHSGLMSWDDCGQMSPDKLSVSLFLDIPKQCLDSGIVSPLWLCWVNGVCMFRCNLPPALLAEWLGSFKCHCGNMGVEQTLNKSQHTKLTLEKKIFLPLLPGFKPTTFQSQVWCSNQQAILALLYTCTQWQIHMCSYTLTARTLKMGSGMSWRVRV